MNFTPTRIPEVVKIDPVVHRDERGFLKETYQREHFVAAGIDVTFVQHVLSRSSRGVLRGLHYQLDRPQGKLVRAAAGEVFDVAVDLRRSSKTFGHWVGETLSADNHRMLWIPPGFAHGFMVLSQHAEIDYGMTDFHHAEDSRTILWNDGHIDVQWPLEAVSHPLLSEKDQAGCAFSEAETYG